MNKRTMDEMISYFNQEVSNMDIPQKDKMTLLGMITAIGYEYQNNAVQVVRCKDCVHRDPEDHRCDCGGHEWVKGKILPVKDDWFCADGARMDGEEKNDD